jgi:hypothetical protein
LLTSEGSWQTLLVHARQSQPMGSAQAATLLEFHLPPTNCFVRSWFCVVRGPKPPLHLHNWLSFGKFQDTERFLIPCPRLPPSGETCKNATAPSTHKKKLERFSTNWYPPFCCVCLSCCAAEFGSSRATYKLTCVKKIIKRWIDKHHMAMWWGLVITRRQAQKFILGPNLTAKTRLLSFNKTQSRVATCLLTGHSTLRRHT